MNYSDLILHYDSLIEEGQDPVCDPPELQDYMNKYDGDQFIKLLELDKSKSALEIGCGTGRLSVRVAPYVHLFCGIDISPKTIQIAKSHLQDYNARLYCDNFLSFHFTEKFDLIFSSLTFMHIKNKYQAIEKIYNTLTKNGLCVISLDKNQNDTIDYGVRKIKIYPDNPKKITDIMKQCGFHKIEKYETEFSYLLKARRA